MTVKRKSEEGLPLFSGFVDFEGAALEISSVQLLNGLFCLFSALESSESEATRLASELVVRKVKILQWLEVSEGTTKVVFSCGEGNVPDVEFHIDVIVRFLNLLIVRHKLQGNHETKMISHCLRGKSLGR